MGTRTTVVFYGLRHFARKTAQADARETSSIAGVLSLKKMTVRNSEKLCKKAGLQLEIRCSIRCGMFWAQTREFTGAFTKTIRLKSGKPMANTLFLRL